jgi:hypothetical protein
MDADVTGSTCTAHLVHLNVWQMQIWPAAHEACLVALPLWGAAGSRFELTVVLLTLSFWTLGSCRSGPEPMKLVWSPYHSGVQLEG